jgi:hypothetical protein
VQPLENAKNGFLVSGPHTDAVVGDAENPLGIFFSGRQLNQRPPILLAIPNGVPYQIMKYLREVTFMHSDDGHLLLSMGSPFLQTTREACQAVLIRLLDLAVKIFSMRKRSPSADLGPVMAIPLRRALRRCGVLVASSSCGTAQLAKTISELALGG